MMPAGPPPMMQQVVASGLAVVGIGADEGSKGLGARQKIRLRARLRHSRQAVVLDSTHPLFLENNYAFGSGCFDCCGGMQRERVLCVGTVRGDGLE